MKEKGFSLRNNFKFERCMYVNKCLEEIKVMVLHQLLATYYDKPSDKSNVIEPKSAGHCE